MKMERYVPIFGSPDTITIATSHICRQKKRNSSKGPLGFIHLWSPWNPIYLLKESWGEGEPKKKSQLPAPPVVFLLRKYVKISQFGCSSCLVSGRIWVRCIAGTPAILLMDKIQHELRYLKRLKHSYISYYIHCILHILTGSPDVPQLY